MVKAGDTLSGIAAHLYGSAGDWPGLYQANKTVVSSPSLIYPGEKLTVPATAAPSSPAAPAAGSPAGSPWTAPTAPAPAPAPSATPPTSTSSTQSIDGATLPVAPGVPAGFQACVITRESGGNPKAVNPSSGAGGLFQFEPVDVGVAGVQRPARKRIHRDPVRGVREAVCAGWHVAMDPQRRVHLALEVVEHGRAGGYFQRASLKNACKI